MKTIDMRFDNTLLREMLGKEFHKYRCDRFEFINSVTQLVGLYIEDKIYSLTNIQEPVDYFGYIDDIGVFKIQQAHDSDIQSAFENVDQIDTPVQECIYRIILVNDCQKVSSNHVQYEMRLTRAIIFDFGSHQISFEKDYVPFSEEIEIRRGYNLIDTLSSEKKFLEEWDATVNPECTREVITICL